MFRTVPPSIISSFSLYTREWYMCHTGLLTACEQDSLRAEHTDPARELSANLYDIYYCCVYSETPLMMDKGTVRNM